MQLCMQESKEYDLILFYQDILNDLLKDFNLTKKKRGGFKFTAKTMKPTYNRLRDAIFGTDKMTGIFYF